MKALAVTTCPVWENLDTGVRRPVIAPEVPPERGRLVGWANALDITIDGEQHRLLLNRAAVSA